MTSASKFSKWAVPTVFLIIAAACFVGLGTQSLYETDEGFAATRADSFFRHQTWRLSFDDVGEDGPQFRKPPLLYWAVAVLFKLIGPNLWAVRLPTALAGFLCAWLTWRLARRFTDDITGLAAAVMLVSTPFVFLHIRTAMLEMPLVFLTLAGTCGFAFLAQRWQRVTVAGLAAGAAVLLKGGAGAYVLAVPLAFGLCYRRFKWKALAEAPMVIAIAILVPLSYFAIVPAEFRTTMMHRLFVDEASQRIRVFHAVFRRMPAAIEVLLNTLAWQVPAAVGGFILLAAGIRRHNAGDRIAFLLLVILCTLPLLWVYASMVHPFPRYLLPAFPLLLILSVTFARCAVHARGAALWLLAFACAAACMGPSALRWIPAGVATGCALLVSLPATSSPVWRSTLSWVLLASIAITSAWAPSSRFYHPDADRGPRPELVPLAQRLQNLVAPAEKVVVEERIKCHTILFYGRRAILFFGDWLLNTAAPGESRYGIFQHLPPEVPGVSAEILQTSGSWHLLKLTVLPSDLPWAGILLARTDEQQGLSILLSQMGVETEPFAKGFVLRRIPVSRLLPIQPAIRISNPDTPLTTAVKIPDPFVVPSNGNLVLDFESPTPCSGVDLIPDNRRQPMEGWKFEYRQGETNNWILLRAVDSPFPGNYAITGRRLERTMERGLRLRFQAIPAKQWRITRTASTPVKISTIRCYGEP